MLATALIVFREVLEAAIIIGIVLAATDGVRGRGRWIGAGIGVGLIVAGLVAAFAGTIADAAEGMGQEIFNATVLFLAVGMLGWHNVWMSRHGRQIAKDMAAMGAAVLSGSRPLYALALAVGLAVLREGSEVVLFLYGIAASGEGAGYMAIGGAAGLAAGIATGYGLYVGLLRIPTRHLFTVTSWMILLLAAGMASQAAGYLAQAGILPALGNAVWDTSAILPQDSVLGRLLHTLVGYTARPSGIEILFYVLTVAVIGTLMRLGDGKRSAGALVAGLVVLVMVLTGDSQRASATHKVFSPIVQGGEAELEVRGHVDFDGDAAMNRKNKHKVGLGYGVTDFWFFEVEGEFEKEPGEKRNFEALDVENIFQLLPQGAYPVDLGLFFEYERADDAGKPDEVEFGPIVQKQFGRVVLTVNPFFAKEVGGNANAGYEFTYGWQAKYRLRQEFEPGFEAFGSPGELRGFKPVSEQRHTVGPAAFGKFLLGRFGAIKYEAGVLFGLTPATPATTFKWLLEYELRI